MIYKISTIVLAVILVTLIARMKYEDSIGQLPEDFNKNFNDRSNLFHIDSGRLITPIEAKKSLDRFASKKQSDWFYTWKKHSYGYFYGLNKLDQFREKIRTINKTLPDTNKIVGIRVYKSMSYTRIDHKKYYDLFMVPVTDNGHNLSFVDEHQSSKLEDRFASDNIVLNRSVPCPNNCDQD